MILTKIAKKDENIQKNSAKKQSKYLKVTACSMASESEQYIIGRPLLLTNQNIKHLYLINFK